MRRARRDGTSPSPCASRRPPPRCAAISPSRSSAGPLAPRCDDGSRPASSTRASTAGAAERWTSRRARRGALAQAEHGRDLVTRTRVDEAERVDRRSAAGRHRRSRRALDVEAQQRSRHPFTVPREREPSRRDELAGARPPPRRPRRGPGRRRRRRGCARPASPRRGTAAAASHGAAERREKGHERDPTARRDARGRRQSAAYACRVPTDTDRNRASRARFYARRGAARSAVRRRAVRDGEPRPARGRRGARACSSARARRSAPASSPATSPRALRDGARGSADARRCGAC